MSDFSAKKLSPTKPNYTYSIISVALVLFLLGFFGLILLQAQRLVSVFKEKVNILVELERESTPEDIAKLEKSLGGSTFVKAGSTEFISKAEAARLLQEDFGDDFLTLDLPNPFYDVIRFNVKAAYMLPDSLQKIRESIRQIPFVNDVYYQQSLVNEISGNVRRIGLLAFAIGLFFIFVAITLIHNTIRLALYSNRFLIKNMELVGATWEFISKPYLMRSMRHGFFSGVMAIVALILLLLLIHREVPELKELQSVSSFSALFLALVVVGILINTLSTYYVVKKYLKMRLDDLY